MTPTQAVALACQHQDLLVYGISLAGITAANVALWSDRFKAWLPAPALHAINFVALHWDDIFDAYRAYAAAKAAGAAKPGA